MNRSTKCKNCKKYLGESFRDFPEGLVDDGTNYYCNNKCYSSFMKRKENVSDPLNKIFMGKTQSKWFNKGRKQILKELEFWLKQNKYPSNNPIRKWVRYHNVKIAS